MYNNQSCYYFVFLLIIFFTSKVSCNLWCYSCVSTQPGCTLDKVDWLIHSAITCPRSDDKCVKIIDKRGSDIQVTRDCLSNIVPFRRDVPADRFEGCRPAASQPKLAVYVDNSVKELDLKKDYYEDTIFCFCEFDEWCNHQIAIRCNSLTLLTIALTSALLAHILIT